MSSTAQAGLAVTGNDAWTQSTATFAHVTGPGWAPPLPPAPTLVGATGGIEQVALKWAASANATSYNVKEATTSGGPYTIVTNLTTTNFRATDVIGDTTYYYVVSAVSSLAGESANSAQVSAVATVNVPLPWMTQDTGAVGLWGSAGCTNGVFTVAGCGADIWNAADAFRFVYVTTRSGTYSIIARVASLQDTDPWSKAGVMIRDSVNSNAANVFLAVTPGNGITWQVRTTDGNSTTNYAVGGVSAPRWVKLACSGNKFTGSYSANGTTWTTLGTTIVSNVTTAYVGLAVASHNDSSLCTATFDNVTAPGWAMPTVPTGLAAVSASLSQINLGWNVSAVAASYTISRSTTSGGTYTVLATGVTTTNYTDTNLTSGTTYYYEVAAVNPAGASANSAPAPATTLSQPRIAGISLVGGSLVFSGTNGSVGGAYTIWSSTNLAAPLTNWLPVGGGNFDGHGNFNATNALNPSQPQQFYLLRQP
jgi:hypothetical protein